MFDIRLVEDKKRRTAEEKGEAEDSRERPSGRQNRRNSCRLHFNKNGIQIGKSDQPVPIIVRSTDPTTTLKLSRSFGSLQ